MRQPGTEHRIDPFQAQGTVEIPAPVLTGQFQKDHIQWATNTAFVRQHKFCANLCVNFKSAGGLAKEEQACIDNCFSKYGEAFSYFQQEKSHFFASMADLSLRGEDKYAAREI